MALTEAFLGTRAQKAFIATKAIVVIVMVAITFRLVEDNANLTDAKAKTIPCYLAIFAFAELYELLMAWDALKARNTIQLGGILIFHAAMIVFGALQAFEAAHSLGNINQTVNVWHKIRAFTIVVPIIIAVSLLVMIWFARALYFEFGWAIFHIVGANPAMKTMYQYYQVMVCLLKFDFFCFIGVTMQMTIVVLSNNTAEFGLTIAAIPVVLILLSLCGMAVRREIKWMMSVSLVLMLAAETYFLYKLVRFYEPSSKAQYESTRIVLTFFTVVAFLLLFITFGIGLRCFADFDKGLLYSKMHTVDTRPSFKQSASGPISQRQSSYVGGAPLQPRMSIE
ncbi:hypothetical protein PUNSTDRAFT_114827 [Punctularia strigosozonata HHB-11173 SS5]|uniref:uncharacterized protein n=1 Tax=Punctularia strigosozonata (strain HHB-11173) TaxID=741275 RepID=UPI0004417A7B|nr:uncharacterized protein PUNSTDRAFT_114827 [Punctularia strigosozonata HHB-11173 SS5]EIN07375.1 hypothetical protein PUNSTDRAFT_114827 [Punctularia strigosozonata HHB-11173 SS5]